MDKLLNRFGRGLTKGFRISMANDPTFMQKGDGVRQGKGETKVVADNNGRYLQAADGGVYQLTDDSCHDGIKTGGGLIKQEDFRV